MRLQLHCIAHRFASYPGMSQPTRRRAFFGGSFDPVHPAHVAIARAAVLQASLDSVIFLPAAQSPLKDHGPEASGPHRLEMLGLALADCPWAEVSDWELHRPGPSYSWQTVEHFQQLAGEDTEWFWLMGVDQWAQLPRWQRWEHLAGLVTFLIFTRDGIVPQPRLGVNSMILSGEFAGSSTSVRSARQEGRAWEALVQPAVAAVIRKERLYQPLRQ